MRPTSTEQESPVSAPAGRGRTYYQIMCDPTLTCAARVAFAVMFQPLNDFGFYAFSVDEIAQAIGFQTRKTSEVFSELESSGVLVSRIRGRGLPKLFSLGPAVRCGIDAIPPDADDRKPPTPRSGGNNSAITGEVSTRESAAQMKLRLDGAAKSRSLSSSRAIARGKLESTTPDRCKLKPTTTTAREEDARRGALLSSLLQKAREVAPDLSRSTLALLLKDCGVERVEREIAMFPRRIAHQESIGKPVRSAGAFFVSAIAGEWGEPPAPVVSRSQFQHAERAVQRSAESAAGAIASPTPIATRDEVEAYHATLADRAADADRTYAAMPAEARKKVDAKIETAIKSLPAGAGADAIERARGLIKIGAVNHFKNFGG